MTATKCVPMPVSLDDYEHLAEQVLDANAWAYLAGGAADETTLRWNREAYARWSLVPRVLKQPTAPETRLELFGRTIAHPILVAPVAYQRLFHENGEIEAATGASAQGALMVLSALASTPFGDVIAAGPACRWLQLYMRPDRDQIQAFVHHAEAAAFEALVVTVDAPLSGLRNREQRAGFRLPQGIAAVNLPLLAAPAPQRPGDWESAVFHEWSRVAISWDDIAWLAGKTSLPVVLKGIASPLDASRAVACGAAGIIVSNHGGRVLDTTAASLDLLGQVVEAVAGQVPVLLDGGIRRGTDVLKAIALGASAVLIGRPVAHGLAVAGAFGVSHVLRLLRDEFELAMALTGCERLSDITPALLLRR